MDSGASNIYITDSLQFVNSITVVATDLGCTSLPGNSVSVTVLPLPTVAFDWECDPDPFVTRFFADSSIAGEGNIVSWNWDFGDGGTSTESNPTYIYQSVGTYTVILHAYGPYGTDTETKTDYINVIAPDAVSADFSALPLIGTAPMGVQFTNNSVGTIDSVRWYFGDGNSSTDLNPAYEYQSAGVYTVLLNVYGPVNDDSKTKEDYITVYDTRPIITDVSDVPNDQGGKVFLRWSPSGFDGPVGSSV
ncbi:MAG: PKD domain-containing protein, partial [Bacteroidetes bacterium]|nr:PKD domain-containing protein [Bacteroidota bacterium]